MIKGDKVKHKEKQTNSITYAAINKMNTTGHKSDGNIKQNQDKHSDEDRLS